MRISGTFVWLAVLTSTAFVAVALLLPTYNSVAVKPPYEIQRSRLGLLWLALRGYAEDNGGQFPKTLSDISQQALPSNERQFYNSAKRKFCNWLYYPGHTMSESPDTILAAFPESISINEGFFKNKEYRIVSTLGTPTKQIEEPDFKRLLIRQRDFNR